MNNLLMQVQNAGVVGAGGAGFPAHVKLDCQVEYVLVNGAECEPLLNKDQVLMQTKTAQMLAGIKLAMAHTGAKQAIIGIKNKNKESIEIVQQHIDDSRISVLIMEDVYPAGDEVELVYEATGRRIPSGGLPKEIGVLVQNVETFINIYNASQNIPVTETMVTVHGEVRKPYTANLPVGMSYRAAIELAGGITCDDFVIIEGGPMMGPITTDLDKPLTKVSSGLIVVPKDNRIAVIKSRTKEEVLKIGKAACDQCSMCSSMCPRNLLGYPIKPHMAMRALQGSSPKNDVISIDAQVCSECNVCTMWSCPEGLDPKQVCGSAKKALRDQNLLLSPAQLQAKTIEVNAMREYRGVPTKRLSQRLGLAEYLMKKAYLSEPALMVKQVKIPLSQHIGKPAVACVKEGESVKLGQMIGKAAENALSTCVHSSINGVVKSINDQVIIIEAN